MKKIFYITHKGNPVLAKFLIEKHLSVMKEIAISPSFIDKIFTYGAVQIRLPDWPKYKFKKSYDANVEIIEKTEIRIFIDTHILALPPVADCKSLYNSDLYGVWIKPPGMMSQGSEWGDHRSLLRLVELEGKTPFLVHRLDREASGLLIIAYQSHVAAYFSKLLQNHLVKKHYLALVVPPPDIDKMPAFGQINQPIDGKNALTKFEIVKIIDHQKILMKLSPQTGRTHQLRQHMAFWGGGIWGDPLYGNHNKNQEGLQLFATGLSFFDTWEKAAKNFDYIPDHLQELL